MKAKVRKQCVQAANKSQSVLDIVKRHFKMIDEYNFKVLYNTYTRAPLPHLEYCVQALSPHLLTLDALNKFGADPQS